MGIGLTTIEKRKLARDGFLVEELKPGVLNIQPQATYYRPDGSPMPNLPADAYSRSRYMRRGLTLAPPIKPVKAKSLRVGVGESAPARVYVCDVCDAEFRVKDALRRHSKNHAETQVQEGE